MLAAACVGAGADVLFAKRVPDDRTAAGGADAILRAKQRHPLVSGGSSVGARDAASDV
jgi:molybdopterin biosynthesis enzyme